MDFELDLLKIARECEAIISEFMPPKATIFLLNTTSLAVFAKRVGVETLSEAFQVWIACEGIRMQLSDRHKDRAEVGYWFGLNPFDLSDVQVMALRDATGKMISQEKIQHGNYDPLDYDGIYRMFLIAFGDEKLARKHQSESFKAYVEKVTNKR